MVCCSCVRKFSDPMYLVDSVFSVMKKSDEYENQQHDADTDVATCTLKSHVRDYHALSVMPGPGLHQDAICFCGPYGSWGIACRSPGNSS